MHAIPSYFSAALSQSFFIKSAAFSATVYTVDWTWPNGLMGEDTRVHDTNIRRPVRAQMPIDNTSMLPGKT